MTDILLIFLGILLVAAALGILVLLMVNVQLRKRAETADKRADEKIHNAIMAFGIKYKEAEKKLRADAIKRSTAVVKGKVAEQLVPFDARFGYNPRDARFLGSPVDLVVFEGLTEGDVTRVVFIEVKSGKHAGLSRRERQVRRAIEDGEVDYEILHIGGRQ